VFLPLSEQIHLVFDRLPSLVGSIHYLHNSVSDKNGATIDNPAGNFEQSCVRYGPLVIAMLVIWLGIPERVGVGVIVYKRQETFGAQ
jgi:hypothetical protein